LRRPVAEGRPVAADAARQGEDLHPQIHGRSRMKPDLAHLAWPLFDDAHRRFAEGMAAWAESAVGPLVDHRNADKSVRALVHALGQAGWLKAVVPAAQGGTHQSLDVRTLCLAREILGWHDGLADFAFAMQ